MRKNNLLCFITVLFIFIMSFVMEQALARKVIAVDSDPNDNGFLSNGEGWARQNMKPGDTIIVGQPLDSTLKKLKNGDTLIIICHGWGVGRGFFWGGNKYKGYGNGNPGDSLHPVPPGFDTLKNVRVILLTCWSERDPDGPDTTDKPLTEKIKKAMGPPSNGNTSTGYTNQAITNNFVRYSYLKSQTDTGTINNFIRSGNQSWNKCPPVNRIPPVTPNQRTCLQTLLDSVKGGAGRVTVGDITYANPVNAPNLALDTCDCICSFNDHCGCINTFFLAEPICESSISSWAPQTSGTVNDLYTVSAVSSSIAWAAGVGPTVRKTTDEGSNWTDATGTGLSGDVYAIHGIDASNAFCGTSSGTSTFLYKTTNGGSSWTLVFTQAGGFIDGIKMTSATEGYALGDPVGGKWTVLKTVNAGNNWIRMATEPTQIGADFGWNNSFRILGNHMWFGTSGTKIYHSSNLGLTWNFATTSGTTNSYAVHFNSVTHGLSGGEALHLTTTGGASYSPAAFPGTGGTVSGISGGGSDWWAVKADSFIYYSSNQGTSWNVVYSQPGSAFVALDISGGSCLQGWVVGAGGGISRLGSGQLSVLHLKAVSEGFWNGTTNIGDTLKVQIRHSVSPFALVDIAKGKNNSTGNVSLSYTNWQIQNGNPYYIVVTHRNSIETWSKTGGEIWSGSSKSYDFTSSLSQAYGNNQVLKSGLNCIYGGDVNQDDVVDLNDIVQVFNDASAFATGYVVTDVNGNDVVDLSDIVLTFNNASGFVSVISP